jgi:hypothetical protein
MKIGHSECNGQGGNTKLHLRETACTNIERLQLSQKESSVADFFCSGKSEGSKQ